jgi:RNA-directed DNA polymerase
MIQKSNMHVDGKSDGREVPTKCPNKSGNPLAEGTEGRRPAKENTEQTTASQTQSWGDALSGLRGVREAAKRDKRLRFTALLHHVSVPLLESSFYALKRDAAPGVDGVTWQEYETGLGERLKDLHSRVHQGTYRAQPSKRTYIPKADGRQRPLGIAALEDKIVQHAVVTVLNQIYEEDFLGFSYGFRPGRRQHDALDALWVGIMRRKVNWILDADIRSFFDEIRHDWLLKFVKHRIADRRILRLIGKWLRAGVSEEGQWSKTERGTPQGSGGPGCSGETAYQTLTRYSPASGTPISYSFVSPGAIWGGALTTRLCKADGICSQPNRFLRSMPTGSEGAAWKRTRLKEYSGKANSMVFVVRLVT